MAYADGTSVSTERTLTEINSMLVRRGVVEYGCWNEPGRGHGWEANPWVLAVTFKVTE